MILERYFLDYWNWINEHPDEEVEVVRLIYSLEAVPVDLEEEEN